MRVTNKITYVGYGLLLEEDTNGTIFVSSPDIIELATSGTTVDGAISNGIDAIECALDSRHASCISMPKMQIIMTEDIEPAKKKDAKVDKGETIVRQGGSPLDMPRPEDMRSLSYNLDNMKHKLRDACISKTRTGCICDLCGAEANDPYTLQFSHAGDCIISALEMTALRLDMIAAWGIHRKKVEARNG